MDPIELIGQLLQLGLVIYRQVDQAKANKTQFKRLANRIKIILDALSGLTEVKDSANFRSGLTLLEAVLTETTAYLEQFISQKWFKRVLKAGADKEKFVELNEQLEKAMQNLSLGMNVQQVMNRTEDREDQRKDTEALQLMQEEILRLNQEELEAIQALQKASEAHTIIMQQQFESMRLQLGLLLKGDRGEPKTPVDRHFLVAFHEILFDRVIGEGSFGTVYAGRWQGQPVAIKTMRGIATKADQEEFIRETQIMSRLRSRWITQFYGLCLEPTRQCLLMEYMERGSLFSRLGDDPLSPDQQRSIALDIVRGLSYLHAQGIIHGDLKSANVLLDSNYQAKLTDFGLSHTRASSIVAVGKQSQAIQWMAPELFQRGGALTAETDRFSYGTILWEMVTGRRPFEHFEGNIVKHLLEGGREEIPPSLPAVYQTLIRKCWDADPSKRPALEEVISVLEAYQPRPPSPTPEEWYAQAQQHEEAKLYDQARESFYRAAQKGHMRAKTSYAFMLVRGLGGLPDKGQAYQWFERGAQEGHDRAQYNLGQMLEYGDGVEKDLNQALFWYRKAHEQSYPNADKKVQRVSEKLAAIKQIQ